MLNDVHCRCRTGSFHIDIELARFLTELTPHLHRTVVMLVSDHGLLESFEAPPADLHMPWLSLLVPRPLLRASPDVAEALRANQHRLVTPFDLFHTLRHIPMRLAGRQQQQQQQQQQHQGGGGGGGGSSHGASVDAATWDEFEERFEANAGKSPIRYTPVPRVGPVGQSLLTELPEGRDCEAAGIPRSVCRLERAAGAGRGGGHGGGGRGGARRSWHSI